MNLIQVVYATLILASAVIVRTGLQKISKSRIRHFMLNYFSYNIQITVVAFICINIINSSDLYYQVICKFTNILLSYYVRVCFLELLKPEINTFNLNTGQITTLQLTGWLQQQFILLYTRYHTSLNIFLVYFAFHTLKTILLSDFHLCLDEFISFWCMVIFFLFNLKTLFQTNYIIVINVLLTSISLSPTMKMQIINKIQHLKTKEVVTKYLSSS